MSHRLLVNPGTPQAWEISLKPGVNRIGRGEQNDFTINHGSVSTHHCEVTVADSVVILKDLGSTNGSFVERAPVTEIQLRPGQHVQFGAVDMTFESNAVSAVTPSPAAPPIPVPVPVPGSSPSVGLRINKPRPAEVSEPSLESEAEAVAAPPEDAIVAIDGGNNTCKSHPKTPARFLCSRCRKYFCDLCVTSRAAGKYCRACGEALTPLRVKSLQPAAERGFYARLPGAFIYPFKGFGLVILFLATAVFGGMAYLQTLGIFRGPFGLLIWIAVYGLLFLFMQNIIHTTTADENEPLGFPEASDFFGAAFQLGATIVVCFWLPIALIIARFFEVEIPMAAIIVTVVLSCLYFPMAFLAVAMKDSVFAANPLVVIPTIFRIPLEYLVATILLIGVYGIRMLGDHISESAGGDMLSTRKMSVLFTSLGIQAVWSFISIYLLTVNMRILGLLYVTKKEKFGWFSR